MNNRGLTKGWAGEGSRLLHTALQLLSLEMVARLMWEVPRITSVTLLLVYYAPSHFSTLAIFLALLFQLCRTHLLFQLYPLPS